MGAALPSRAESTPTVVVIVDGPGGDALADQLTNDKLGGLVAVARKPKSVPCKLGSAKGPKGKAKSTLDTCLRKTVDADAIVLVVITKGPKGRVADVRVVPHEGSGSVTEQHLTLAAKPGPTDATKVKGAVEPALAPYAPKPKSTSTSTSEATSDAATEASAASSTTAAPVDKEGEEEAKAKTPGKKDEFPPRPNAPRISVAIGPGFGARSFSFHGGSGPSLRPYSLKSALLFGVAAEGYPGDDGEGLRFRPGLAFTYITSSGLASVTEAGRTIGNTWTRVDVGLRGRLSLGGDRAPVFTIGFGWSREAFVFTEADPSLPSATYATLRASLDARVPIGPVALLATFAALPGLRLSGATDPFRERSVLGLDGLLGLAVPFARTFEFRLLASHTRYSTKFVTAPGATVVATGTTDSYSRLQVLLAFLY